MTTAVADPRLAKKVQDFIQAQIVTHGLTDGIGSMSRADLEQHLQEIVCIQYARWDPTRGASFFTYVYDRLRFACRDLKRLNAAVTRSGKPRRRPISLNAPLAGAGAADQNDGGTLLTGVMDDLQALEIDGINEAADLTLALQSMPARMRIALLLLFYEGLTERSAAERMGITPDAIRALRDAAVTKCRLALVRNS